MLYDTDHHDHRTVSDLLIFDLGFFRLGFIIVLRGFKLNGFRTMAQEKIARRALFFEIQMIE